MPRCGCGDHRLLNYESPYSARVRLRRGGMTIRVFYVEIFFSYPNPNVQLPFVGQKKKKNLSGASIEWSA